VILRKRPHARRRFAASLLGPAGFQIDTETVVCHSAKPRIPCLDMHSFRFPGSATLVFSICRIRNSARHCVHDEGTHKVSQSEKPQTQHKKTNSKAGHVRWHTGELLSNHRAGSNRRKSRQWQSRSAPLTRVSASRNTANSGSSGVTPTAPFRKSRNSRRATTRSKQTRVRRSIRQAAPGRSRNGVSRRPRRKRIRK